MIELVDLLRVTVGTTASDLPSFGSYVYLQPDPANTGHIYLRRKGGGDATTVAIPVYGMFVNFRVAPENLELIASDAAQYLGIIRIS